MVNHRLRLSRHQGHVQRLYHQVRCHALAEGPAHNLAAVHVDDHRQVQEPGPRRYVGHVGHPQLVDVSSYELTFHQVGCRSMAHITFSGPAETASPAHPTYLRQAHQAGNAFAAGHNACLLQLSADAWHAVGLVAGDKGCADLRRQSGIGLLSLAQRAPAPIVEATGGYLEGFAHGAYR